MKNILLFFLPGIALTFIGIVLGLLLGAQYGGNHSPLFEYGDLPGYEGTGLLGSVLGASVFALLWICFRLKDDMRQYAVIVWLIAATSILVLEHMIAGHGYTVSFALLFLPLLLPGLLLAWRTAFFNE